MASASLFAADEAAAGFDTGDHAVFADDAGDLAILDQVDAAHVGSPRIAPGDGVMAGRAAAALQQAAEDREAVVIEIQIGRELAHLLAIEQFAACAFEMHGVAAPGIGVALAVRVVEVEHAALGDHGVIVEVLLEAFQSFIDSS